MSSFKCERCGMTRTKGQVIEGRFICAPCIKDERQAKATGRTRYAVVGNKKDGTFSISSAIYTETAKRFNRVRCDDDWPYYEAHALKKYSWSGMPGSATPHEAIKKDVTRREEHIKTLTEGLEHHTKEAEALKLFAASLGPPPDPSTIDPTD